MLGVPGELQKFKYGSSKELFKEWTTRKAKRGKNGENWECEQEWRLIVGSIPANNDRKIPFGLPSKVFFGKHVLPQDIGKIRVLLNNLGIREIYKMGMNDLPELI